MTSDQGAFLFVDYDHSQDISPSTVFYRCTDGKIAESLCRLFAKEYADSGKGIHFGLASVASISEDDQILINEAIQDLEIYSDPDPHVYEPIPPKALMERAQFAVRAKHWESHAHNSASTIQGGTSSSVAAEWLVFATDPDKHFGDTERAFVGHGAVIASIKSLQLAEAVVEMYRMKRSTEALSLCFANRSTLSVVQNELAEREIARATDIGSMLYSEDHRTEDPVFMKIGICSLDFEELIPEMDSVVTKYAQAGGARSTSKISKKYMQSHSDVVVLFMIARDLVEIGRDYPNALPKSEHKSFLNKVLIHAMDILNIPHFQESKALVESGDMAKQDPAIRYGLAMSTLLVVHPEFVVPIGGDGQVQIREEIEKVMGICQDSVSPKVEKMKARLAEIMVISCRMPEDKKNKEFSETARYFQMLQHYWPLALRLIQIQAEGKVGYQPHPLLDFIVNLQDRLQKCFSSLPSDSETKIAHEACSNLMEVMVDGEIDDLSAVPEWTNGEILKVNTFIARTRMQMGTREYELTCAEEYFVKHVDHQIDKYKKQTSDDWRKLLKRIDATNQTNKENELSQSGQNQESNHASHDDSSGMDSKTSITTKKSVGLNPVADDKKVDAVVLGKSKGDPCMVLGNKKPALTDGHYAVIEALLEAGDEGMTKDQIENVRKSARRMLRDMREDDDWAKVILMPGQTNKRYRIK